LKLGLDVFLEETGRFKGKRIGLVTNMTGVNQKLMPAIDLFHEHPDIQLTALYAPEHGIRGSAREGEMIETFTDPKTKRPVYSLYGSSKKPSKKSLEEVDVIVFDLQDIGSRYYTYIYTMAYMMEACGEYNKEFVVLDRPNPIGGIGIEGNLAEEGFRSFVGLYPIPNRHGMTVGELARLFKHEFGVMCDLTVIPMEGWERRFYFEDTDLLWVPPSPNTTTIDMTVLYPGTCLLEGTNISEGRGTTKPFEYAGAPFIDGSELARAFNALNLEGVIARPVSFTPALQKYKDQPCEGVQLHVADRKELNSFQAGVKLLELIAGLYPEDFEFIRHVKNNRYFFDLLAGNETLRELILEGKADDYFEACKDQVERFRNQRAPYLLYK
jgi:uncharacterized protein YbbC (DUF1343 family)